MPIHVGCSGLPMQRARYFETFNAVEVIPSQEVPPKPKSASRWVAEAPEGFRFSMVASRLLVTAPSELPPGLEGDPKAYGGLRTTQENLALFQRTVDTAKALGGGPLLIITTPQIGPSPRGRERLRRFFETVDRGEIPIVWEPHGPWENDEVEAIARDLGLLRCFDPLRDPLPDGGIAYARLGPFVAMGRSMADDELEDIVAALEDYEEAYCFFGNERAFADARRLLELTRS